MSPISTVRRTAQAFPGVRVLHVPRTTARAEDTVKPPRCDVAVVLSTFNRSVPLERALIALLNQRVPPTLAFEIIVVDNNSSDGTAAVVARIATQYAGRLRYAFEPRRGVSYGRNTGVALTGAPIVAFTDDDNVVGETWVATIRRALDENPGLAAVGGRVLPEPAGTMPDWIDRRHWSPLAILDFGDQAFYTDTANPRCLLTANLAIRREVFNRVGGFSPDFPRCQDHELLMRLWRSGERALYLPALVVHATIPPERLTHRYHRAWYARHGVYAARMRLEEVIGADGRLFDQPIDAVRLYGTPAFVYRQLLGEVRGWCRAMLGRDAAARLRHRHRIGYLSSYIWERARTVGPKPVGLKHLVAFGTRQLERAARRLSMSPRRLVLAHVVFAVLLIGAAYDVVTGTEHWPFSPYPMFSTVQRDYTASAMRVVGVTDDGVPREFALLDRQLIHPFDQCRLDTVLARATSSPERRPYVRDMLRDVFERYERNRPQAGAPRLKAVRLYRMSWALDPWARNVDRPTRAELIEEVDVRQLRAAARE